MALSVRNRILLYLALPMLVFYSGLLLVQLRDAESEATKQATGQLLALVETHATRVDSRLREVEQIVRAQSSFFAHATQIPRVEIYDIFSETLAQTPLVHGLGVAFKRGVRAESDQAATAPYLFRGSGEQPIPVDMADAMQYDSTGTPPLWWRLPRQAGRLVWTPPYFDAEAGTRTVITCCAPIVADGIDIGIVGIDITPEQLGALLPLPAELGDNVFIVDPEGRPIWSPADRGQATFMPRLVAAFGEAPARELVNRWTRESAGILPAEGWVDGEPAWLIHAPIGATNWALVAHYPRHQIAGSVRRRMLRASLGLGLVVVLSMACVWHVSRLITRPLVQLNATVTDLVSKRLGETAVPASRDELATLSRSFTDLAVRLADKEAELSAMLANLPGTAYRYTRQGNDWQLALVSDGCRELTGYAPALFLSGTVTLQQLIHPQDAGTVAGTIARHLRAGSGWTLTYRIQRSDGSTRWIYEQGIAGHAEGNNGDVYDGFMIDITDRKQAEEQVQHREEVEALIASISASFIHARPEHLDDTLRTALRSMGVFVGVDHVYILSLEAGTRLRLTCEWTSPRAKSREGEWHDLAVDQLPYTQHLVFNGDFLHVPDTTLAPIEASVDRQFWHANQIRAMLAVPVLSKGEVAGLLALDTMTEPRPWSMELITMVRIVAEVVGSAIARRSSEAILRQTQERFELVTRVAAVYDLDFASDRCWWTGLDRLVGINHRETTDTWLFSLMHPEERPRLEQCFEAIRRGQQRYLDAEYRLARVDGGYAYVHDEGQVICDDSGKPVRMVGVLVDVSQLRAAVEAKERSEAETTIKAQVARLAQETQGLRDLHELLQRVITDLSQSIGAGHGACYLVEYETDGADAEPRMLRLMGTYAQDGDGAARERLAIGETLVGQCVLNAAPLDLTNVPESYLPVRTGMGHVTPGHVLILPVLAETRVVAVIELASMAPISPFHRELLNQTVDMLGAVIVRIRARQQTEALLAESQRLARELAEQQNELRASNELLQEQTRKLRESEDELRVQQEELELSNEELEEKTRFLQEKSAALANARNALAKKASELELANRYKSEFLANMSHELRTPLNSLLLLARQLAENAVGNLNIEQQEAASIIHASGNDLLSLINELLDLAKIEAGRMDFFLEEVAISELTDSVSRQFRHVAVERGLELRLEIAPEVPEQFCTDRKRLMQVLRNLLSNALKFTEQGHVCLRIAPYAGEPPLTQAELPKRPLLVMAVSDSGCGIPADKFQAIFEAFQQADGSTSRKYGGTGLGLSICREIAIMLEGEIHVDSEPGEGSTFSVCLPMDMQPSEAPVSTMRPSVATPAEPDPLPLPAPAIPRAAAPLPGAARVLIIEDDLSFARVLQRECRERGLGSVHCTNGQDALEAAAKGDIDAVITDIGLPGMDGWEIVERLRQKPATADLPVHIMSAHEETGETAAATVLSYLVKPVSHEGIVTTLDAIQAQTKRSLRHCLIVEDNAQQAQALEALLRQHQLEVLQVAQGKAALEVLGRQHFDCMVLDLALPDMTGFELLERMHQHCGDAMPAVIVYTARDLTAEDRRQLQRCTRSVIVKSPHAADRLLDQIDSFLEQTLCLNQRPEKLPPPHAPELDLTDRVVLIIDDDMRTLFALAKFLREKGATIHKAPSIRQALDRVGSAPAPELIVTSLNLTTGTDTHPVAELRRHPALATVPMIALATRSSDRQAAREAGVALCIDKPLADADLAAAIAQALHPPLGEVAP